MKMKVQPLINGKIPGPGGRRLRLPGVPWLGERGGPIADARLAACNEDDDGSNMFEPTIFFY